jgi:hypothetical protein
LSDLNADMGTDVLLEALKTGRNIAQMFAMAVV